MSYVEADIGQDKEAPKPQSDKLCEECLYFDRDLTKEPCWTCYECELKCQWEKLDDSDRDSESEQMDGETCKCCKAHLFS